MSDHFPRPVKQWHHSYLEWRTLTTFAITLTSFQRERRHQKGDVKGHFPSLVCTFKKPKKSPQERKKIETCSFVSCHWFSQCEKAQPCKISVEVGGGPQQQCAFFHRRNLKEIHCPPCVPNTHSGVCPLFMVQTEAGKGMRRWSWRHEMSHRNTMKECLCVWFPHRITNLYFRYPYNKNNKKAFPFSITYLNFM